MSKPERRETAAPAVGFSVDQPVGRPVPERDSGDALGVHWIGGRPHMLTSDAPAPKKDGPEPPLLESLRLQWPDTPHHRDSLHRQAADEIERLRELYAATGAAYAARSAYENARSAERNLTWLAVESTEKRRRIAFDAAA